MSTIFSENYSEARDKFLAAAGKAEALIKSYDHPMMGPAGERLYLDSALLGPLSADNFIVLISGTHGVEGFAGSAVQTGVLKSDYVGRLPESTGLLFIHALNPYGFAHLRRFNENNVDLNRNFVDHDTPNLQKNRDYDRLSSAIAPESISFLSNTLNLFRALGYAIKNDFKSLKRAISQGQYSHPEGLFYGGDSRTWSNRILHEITAEYLSGAKRIIVIDFHTGLGEYGDAEVIINEPPGSDTWNRAVRIWGVKVTSTLDGGSVSEDIQGSLKLAMPRLLPDAELTAMSLEFGTVSSLEVFRALRNENWYHHYVETESAEKRAAKIRLKRAFYPSEEEWQRKVWLQGREAFVLALAGFSQAHPVDAHNLVQ